MLDAGLDIAPIAIHTSSFSVPQFYTAETIARAAYYGVSSYPTTWFDGIINHVAAVALVNLITMLIKPDTTSG